MKAQIYLLITFALFTLLLSCGPDDTAPSSQSGSQPVSIGFSLAQGANSLSLTNSLVFSTNTYVLTITNSSSQLMNSNFYSISYSPEDALTKVNQTSNTLSFQVTNADLGSVKLTATHTNDNTLTRDVTLNLTKAEYSASQIPIAYSPTNIISTNGTYPVSPINIGNLAKFFPKYPLSVSVNPALPVSISDDGRVSLTTEGDVSTNLVTVTFSSSNYVDYSNTFYVEVHTTPVARAELLLSSGTAPLTFRGGNYTVTANLTNSDGSKVAGITEDFRFSATPSDAIVGINSNNTSYTFVVTNADYDSVTINAVHKQSNTLTAVQTFTLAKATYSASETPIAYSPTNTVFASDTYSLSPTIRDISSFYLKSLQVRVSPALPAASISDDGIVSLTVGASASTNEVTVTFSSSNYVDYITNFYVRVRPTNQVVLSLSPNTSPLTFGGGNHTVTAKLTNSDGEAVGITEYFRFSATPPEGVVVISSNTNSYTFAVTNASYGSVTINAVHQQSNTLSAGQSFTLAKASSPSGVTPIAYSAANNVAASLSTPGKISPSSDTRANYYPQGLTLSRVSGPTTYSFNSNTGEISFTTGGSYEFQVTFISSNYTNYTTPKFTVTVEQITRFEQVVRGGSIPNLTNETDELTRTVLAPLGVAEGQTLVARYATESGTGTKNGTNWANAWAATDLRGGINGISDASANKAYVVLVASGTYKPTDGTDQTISFSMKNHTAIVGGFTNAGGWKRSGTTTFSGDIGTEGNINDNSHNVFIHNRIPLDNGLLYGVTITRAYGHGTAPHNRGGGMYNEQSSPRLVNVVFVSNTVASSGGGMYNLDSSPVLTGVEFTGNSASGGGGMYNQIRSSSVLTRVVFDGNSANNNGGGMYNDKSSPVLTRVEFTGNSANKGGGGMYNKESSSPVLRGVVFDGNSANDNGGGMYNLSLSSPVLVGAVFRGNSAKSNGGGMHTYFIPSGDGPIIVNSIFVSNSVTVGVGKDIALDRSFSGTNINVRIAGSVLGGGTANATNGIVVITTDGSPGSFDITHHSLANGAVNFGADATTTSATGGLTYPTIQSTSSAKDIGLYVRKSGSTYYFSEDNSSWYTKFLATGGFDSSSTANPPADAEDLTATDIAGNTRNGRPDAGVHEYR